MKKLSNFIAVLFTITIIISVAGCAEKTQTVGNGTVLKEVTTAVEAANSTVTKPVSAPAVSQTANSSVTTAPLKMNNSTETNSTMKGMGSSSSASLDSSSEVEDIVCKMVIDKKTAEYTSDYEGTKYYFCALSCKQKFDENPEKYINSESNEAESMDTSEQATTTETADEAITTGTTNETITTGTSNETTTTGTANETTTTTEAADKTTTTGIADETNSTNSAASTVVDVVCKMEINKNTAEFTSEYKGTKYYFCSADCKNKFDENPEKYLNNPQEIPVATFIASPLSGNSPLSVTFSDESTGTPTSWKWNFGDGNTSSKQNPSHIYYTSGKYTISLMVSNINGTNTTYATVTVFQSSVPSVNFSSNVTRGYSPLSVQFRDLSKNATKWKWDFGDGTNSTGKNPVHIYNKNGKFSVTLTVWNEKSNNKITKYNYINVDSAMVTDVVCKMVIDKRTAEFKSVYKGTTYYFCREECKKEFDKNPEDYLGE